MLLSSASVTGPAEICLGDARALRDVGHSVVFGCDTRRQGDYAEAIEKEGFDLDRELALCQKASGVEVVRDIAHLHSRFRRGDFDLVHARFSHDHVLSLFAVTGVRDRPRLIRTAEIRRSLEPGRLRSLAFRRTDGVIVSNRDYERRLVEQHGVSPDRIGLVPGRVDAVRFAPGDGERFRSRIGVPPGAVLFGIVSRIKSDRLHSSVVQAFVRIASSRQGVRLAIIGRGEGEEAVRNEVDRLGIGSVVAFAGYCGGDDLVAAYRGLDVAVWLAEGNDGTCRGVLEAMACGRPVIAGRAGAMVDLVVDGETGHLVDPNDVDSVASAMAKLADDAQARSTLGSTGRRRAAEYTAAARAARLLSFYERTLERPRALGISD